MKKVVLPFFGVFLLLLASGPALAGWIAYADYSACPRKYFPNPNVQEGPFATSSDCQAVISRADREQNVSCARYSCKETSSGSGASSSGSTAPGHEMDKHIGDAISAGLSGQISGADAIGLMSLGIMGNAILGANAPETAQQAATRRENERIWAEQSARAAQEAQIKEAAFQMQQDSESFAMLDLAANEFQPQDMTQPKDVTQHKAPEISQAFTKGFEHASQCISQNSGAACAGSKSETCLSDYRAGYEAGKKDYNLMMEQALQAGKIDGAKGAPMDGGAKKNAVGSCRTEWIQQYNRGHWMGRHPKASK